MGSYLTPRGTRGATPQTEKIPGRTDQVRNDEDGYVFAVGPAEALRRFLILGAEGGTFYASQDRAVKDGTAAVVRALDELGPAAVAVIVDVSVSGAAVKQDPVIYALALACAHSNEGVRDYAYNAVQSVIRTGTQMFMFVEFVKAQRGFGRGLSRAITAWYDRPPEKVAYQVVKYRQRNGWTHRDVLRIVHPKLTDANTRVLMKWVMGKTPEAGGALARQLEAGGGAGPDGVMLDSDDPLRIIEGYERAMRSPSPAKTATLIRDYALTREMVKPDHLTDPEVWIAMLDTGMPIGALVRNLPTMTRHGALQGMGRALAVAELNNEDAIKRSRIHPLSILNAMTVYKSGRSVRGGNTWTPIADVLDALDAAFYLAFDNVVPTGLRHMLALDISGSMTWHPCSGFDILTPRDAAAAMALVTAQKEPNRTITAFAADPSSYSRGWKPKNSKWGYQAGIMEVAMSPRQRLDDAVRTINQLPAGGTDCSLPMLYAVDKELMVDVFVVYTDSETYAGIPHANQALAHYRKESGLKDAKMVVVGMTSNGFTIADPTDPNMLDVVGFDTRAPQVISQFARGWQPEDDNLDGAFR